MSLLSEHPVSKTSFGYYLNKCFQKGVNKMQENIKIFLLKCKRFLDISPTYSFVILKPAPH